LHTDETKKWHDCSLKESVNIKVDRLAKKALKAALCTREFIKASFLYEQIWIMMGGEKVTGPLWLELEKVRGHSTTKKFKPKGDYLIRTF
jgi:hypothetical protein